MTNRVKRTTRVIKVVVETTGKSDQDHDRIVTWATDNMSNANRHFPHAFVAAAIYDENDQVLAQTAWGPDPSPGTQELIKQLVSGPETGTKDDQSQP